MSDSDAINQANVTQKKRSPSGLKEQIGDAGAQVKQRAGEAMQASADAAREKFSEAADAAKEVAGDTMEQVQSRAREQQQTSADFVERLAGNFRQAAGAFETDVPFAARGINSAADYIDDAAAKIRDGSFRDLVDGATDFAKRQPAAFLGLSVLAGFAAVRFLKASGGKSSQTSSGSQHSSSGSQQSSSGSQQSSQQGGSAS